MDHSIRLNNPPVMNNLEHYSDTSEENKENLPPWLLEQRELAWAQARTTPTQHPAPRQALRIRRLRRNEIIDEELIARIANISMSGRGAGGTYFSSTVPTLRPKRRTSIPDEFRIEIYNDSPSPVFEEPLSVADVVPEFYFEIFNDEPSPSADGLQPIVYTQPQQTQKVLSAIRSRPRAFTFPGRQDPPLSPEAPYGNLRIQTKSLVVGLEVGLMVEKHSGRRVKSMTIQPSPLLEIDGDYLLAAQD